MKVYWKLRLVKIDYKHLEKTQKKSLSLGIRLQRFIYKAEEKIAFKITSNLRFIS